MRLREIILRSEIKYLKYKIYNIFKYFISRKFSFTKLAYLPLKMDIEPTTGCNFRCTMCAVSSPGYITKNMKMDVFKKNN